MSDTSTLTAIKYKGQMIGLPITDPSVLVSKEELFDSSTTPGSTVPASVVKGIEMYVGPAGNDYKSTLIQVNWTAQPYRAYIPILQYKEGDDLWAYSYYGDYCYIEFTHNNVTYWFVIYKDGSIVMTSDNIEGKVSDGVYYNGNFVYYLDDTTFLYWLIQYHDVYFYSCTYTPAQIIPGQSTYSIKSEYLNGLDTSVSQLWDSSTSGGGGGSADLTNYYTKTQIDTSIANNYASKNDISAFITSNDVSIYLTDNDISTFITANDISAFITSNDISTFVTDNDISAFITSNDISTFVTDNDISTFITANDVSNKLEANDVSLFITSNDISTFITENDVSIYSTNTYVNSTFAKISYISLSDYDNLQVKDPSTLYIIPS